MTDFLTPEGLAAHWKRPVEWVRRAANAGDIPGVKIGGLWRFDPADIEAFETRHKNRDPLTLTSLSAKRQATKAARGVK